MTYVHPYLTRPVRSPEAVAAELDSRAVDIARGALKAAIGNVSMAIRATQDPTVRQELHDLLDGLHDLMRDHIDCGAAYVLDCQRADEAASARLRELAADRRWHEGRLGL